MAIAAAGEKIPANGQAAAVELQRPNLGSMRASRPDAPDSKISSLEPADFADRLVIANSGFASPEDDCRRE